MPNTTVLRKIFGSGQVTLPKRWREGIETDTVSVQEKEGELRIIPIKTEASGVIFDSAKVGHPEGVEIKQFLKALKKANQNG